MTETEALIALNMLPKVGPVRIRALAEAMGGVARVPGAPVASLLRVRGIGSDIAEIIARWEEHADLQGELRRIREYGLTILTEASPEYPDNLRRTEAPPAVLYVRGRVEPRDRLAIGVVGSRRATTYGLNCAKKLSFQLAAAGVTVISGLARGIDTAAHEAAVAARGRTIAVLGSGHGRLFPPENAALAEKIADGHGAVVSEFPVLTEPDRQTFPQRNRIVSGWSQGVLVVEAPAWSGALITANNAADQGRSIYAVPGPIDRESSAGCNRLIQNGARLVTDASDIIEDLNLLLPPGEEGAMAAGAPAAIRPAGLSDEEAAIWDAIGTSETHLDDLIESTGLAASTVIAHLMRMEIARCVRKLPGNRFVRLLEPGR